MMNSESFDLITQELIKQQQAMEVLQAENRELRQQLTDLRTGRGVFIEINGKRFALNASFISQTSIQVSGVQSSPSVPQEASPSIADKPTMANPKVLSAETARKASPSQNNKQTETSSSTFLEEAMISEFTSAMASPLTLLQDPINQQEEQKQKKNQSKQKKSGDEQQAVLRHDLMGSYLLD
jgi:hypothetical protein